MSDHCDRACRAHRTNRQECALPSRSLTLKICHFSIVAGLLSVGLAFGTPPQIDAGQITPTMFDVHETDDGLIVAFDTTGTYVFDTWDEYLASKFFQNNGARCGMDRLDHPANMYFAGSVNDCSNSITVPSAEYDPQGGATYDIPVVVHVLYHRNGNGNIDDARIHEQIQILNQDFGVLSNGNIQFHLATEDPSGNATTGITRHRSNTWYNDAGSYASTIGWDTNRYLNIYTNTAGGNLGYAYVPSGGGVVGSSHDGVRILWRAFGYSNYFPYDEGRTATHEVGHYLGLHHTFEGGCHSGGCYTAGDLICDTNSESSPNTSGCSRTTCGSSDPVKNFMDYSADACMDHFTPEQINRTRCTLANWRSELWSWEGGTTTNPPSAPDSPSPAASATGVATNTTLSWGAGSGATSYNVYFGTGASPASAGSVGGTSYTPGTLIENTTYYWRVESVNNDGVASGPTWSFTTLTGGSGGGSLFADGFESGGFGAGNWSVDNRNARVKSGAANTGSFGVECKQTTGMQTTVALGGASSILVQYDKQVSGFDNGESLTVAVYQGASLMGSTSHGNGSYGAGTLVVNGLAGGNVTLRFSTNASSRKEKAFVDNVVVSEN